MFSLFYTKRKILGLDITEEYIRYAVVVKSKKGNRVTLCGEEKIARVEPRNALLSAIRNIMKKTKQKKANVSFSRDFVRSETISIPTSVTKNITSEIEFRLTEKTLFSYGDSILYYEKFESINDRNFYTVFISSTNNVAFLKSVFVHSGLRVGKLVSHKDALVASCIRDGEINNAMVINSEYVRTDIAVFSPFNRFKEIHGRFVRDIIPQKIKETHQDFYSISGDNISYFFLAGSLAQDFSFINFVSVQTRLPIQQADVFVNFTFNSGQLPPVTKEQSFLYAVALGAAIR